MTERAMQHTPGPWTAERQGTQGVANYTVIGTPANWHTEIARVYHGARFVNGDANARLIAAAPELLDALRLLLADEGEHNVGCKEYAPGHDDSRCCPVRIARAAIAKAEGQ